MVYSRSLLALGVKTVTLVARHCSELQAAGGEFRVSKFAAHRAHSQLWTPFWTQVNRMSCCAKVDLPPPTEVTVEYHDKPEMTDYFIELADGIENAHPDIMVTGNPEGMQPRDGAFEVTTGAYVLFSKLKENRLPSLEDILRAIDERPTQALSCELENGERAANV
ncbi:hypothetical protein MPTK1_6g06130 [Marchantia polymorpha subsp. ruderalis]|uniref:Uncharacterized protein n=2 Tax=Marchantia polymorpha TaxID=3197 RepID=A0A176VQM5_MARPO|nr:hypothetical protein AXG93_2675s1270 [Marchantia polymorpha subsp. ruderalis]PTQ32545.1 hypothetical protein MARPO_0097s0031 [Marchantia polymorpha]BBN13767.1 hypothetical protein Mp_6g06130 [Marchantia polymorpha subsp. ruderalis]|eukprot:PTQ32545.1 hypothetical protein MARPO_0097s0031 [Marchantia polymorpha]